MEKRNIWGIIGVVVLIFIILLIAFAVGKNGEDELSEGSQQIVDRAVAEASAISDDAKKEFTFINVDEYLDYYNGSEAVIVLLARPTCQYCAIAEPILQHIAYTYNLDIKYLNTDDFDEESQMKFVQSNERYHEGYGTPNLLIVANSSIIDIVDGLTDTEEYLEFFQENGFIN